jgi:hypothetical protein
VNSFLTALQLKSTMETTSAAADGASGTDAARMTTEEEKMLMGDYYQAFDPHLLQQRQNAKQFKSDITFRD